MEVVAFAFNSIDLLFLAVNSKNICLVYGYLVSVCVVLFFLFFFSFFRWQHVVIGTCFFYVLFVPGFMFTVLLKFCSVPFTEEVIHRKEFGWLLTVLSQHYPAKKNHSKKNYIGHLKVKLAQCKLRLNYKWQYLLHLGNGIIKW